MDQLPNTNFFTKFNNPKNIAFTVFVMLLVGFLAFAGIQTTRNSKPGSSNISNETKGNFLSNHTIVYGSWNNNASNIVAYDLSNGGESILATLPGSIKKVNVLTPDTIIFINKTDLHDTGEEISIYSLTDKTVRTLVKASNGVRIDDYILSPNNEYLATWEIAASADTGVLAGGKSQIYTVRISSPNDKNLLYEENASTTNPVHYPVAVTNGGDVFTDKFAPNTVAGWAYGMSISTFNGSVKNDITNVSSGTYGTKPLPSPDGNYIVISGYDGALGPGSSVENGYRKALTHSNSVDILNTSTLERTKLSNLPASNYYPYVAWDGNSTIILYMVTPDINTSGLYSYSLFEEQPKKLKTGEGKFFVETLSSNSVLVGNKNTADSYIGNLGQTYASPFSSFYIFDTNTNKSMKIPSTAPLMQFVKILPSGYFGANISLTPAASVLSSGKNIQLASFEVKPELSDTRERGQQDPPPSPTPVDQNIPTPTLFIPQRPNNNPLPQQPTSTPAPQGEIIDCQAMARRICTQQHPNDINARGWCIQDLKPQLLQSGQCNSSPLYLYGRNGELINVTINTPVFNSLPEHNSSTYSVQLEDKGNFKINNTTYSKISFDYQSALRKIPQLTKGIIVSKDHTDTTLLDFARRLNLNDTETKDLIQLGKSSIYAPFAFISFYNHETSHAILPISFEPRPDVYRNIVFYFKNLGSKPNFSVPLPIFEPIKRQGFTAIEISAIVE